MVLRGMVQPPHMEVSITDTEALVRTYALSACTNCRFEQEETARADHILRLGLHVTSKSKRDRAADVIDVIAHEVIDLFVSGYIKHTDNRKPSAEAPVHKLVAVLAYHDIAKNERSMKHGFILHWPFVGMFVEQIEGISRYIGERYRDKNRDTSVEITPRYKHHTMFNSCYNLSSNKRTGKRVVFSHWVQSDDVSHPSDSVARMAHLNLFEWGVFRVDKGTVHWVYPFLMTQFPMFCDTFLYALTPTCTTLMRHNGTCGVNADYVHMETENLLKCIEIAQRHTDVRYQHEVGKHVHVVTSGSTRGFMLWHNWLHVRPLDGQECCGSNSSIMMLREQWMSWIPHRGKDRQSINELHAMAKEQNPVKYTVLMNSGGDNKKRDGDDDDDQIMYTEERSREMYRMYGTLTHLDIANYIYIHIRGKAVSTGNQRYSTWYVFDERQHRWVYDPSGSMVVQMIRRELTVLSDRCHRLSMQQEDREYQKPKDKLSVMLMYPKNGSYNDIMKEITLHLKYSGGDIHQNTALAKALSSYAFDQFFHEKLDTTVDNLIPFNNGVLDVSTGVLDKGKAMQYLCKGPGYDYREYDASDRCVRQMEMILTKIFPNHEIRLFALDVLASVLQKKNRFKHFYIISGGTNAGKSLLLAILRDALGELFCTIPVTALTCRESDPSNHTDYLARTRGCNMVVCNEPDATSQTLLPDQIKKFTSDTDKIPVREIYGSTHQMVITWKLFMACNAIPQISAIDTAAYDRTKVIPCISTFTDETRTDEEEFRVHIFKANRNIDPSHQKELGKALMSILVKHFVSRRVNDGHFRMQVPTVVRLHTDNYMSDLQKFRMFVKSFVFPVHPIHHEVYVAHDVHSIWAERGKAIRGMIPTDNVFLVDKQEHAGDIKRIREAAEEFWLEVAFVLQGNNHNHEVAHKMVTISTEEIVNTFSQFLNDEMNTGDYSTMPGNETGGGAETDGGSQKKSTPGYNKFIRNKKKRWTNVRLDWALILSELRRTLCVTDINGFWCGFSFASCTKRAADQHMMPEDNICQFVNAVFMEWKDKIGVYPPYITCVNQIDLNFVIRRYINNRESIENVQSGVNGYATQLLNDNKDMLSAARTCLINGSAGVRVVDDHLHITYNDTDDAFVMHSTVAHHAIHKKKIGMCMYKSNIVSADNDIDQCLTQGSITSYDPSWFSSMCNTNCNATKGRRKRKRGTDTVNQYSTSSSSSRVHDGGGGGTTTDSGDESDVEESPRATVGHNPWLYCHACSSQVVKPVKATRTMGDIEMITETVGVVHTGKGGNRRAGKSRVGH